MCAVAPVAMKTWTHSTLLALRDEEVPQRIAFVSDKVFEPSWMRRTWRAFWGSAPRLGFASAAMLSAALVVFAFFRPAALPAPAINTAKIEQQVSERVAAAAAKAVAESEARQAAKTAELLRAAEQRYDAQRQVDMENVAQSLAVMQKRYNVRESLLARLEEPK